MAVLSFFFLLACFISLDGQNLATFNMGATNVVYYVLHVTTSITHKIERLKEGEK